MSEAEIPPCLGRGASTMPYGPCDKCVHQSVCKFVTKHFIPKKDVLLKIEKIEAILRGD